MHDSHIQSLGQQYATDTSASRGSTRHLARSLGLTAPTPDQFQQHAALQRTNPGLDTMPSTPTSYVDPQNDISELVNTLAAHDGPFEIITAKAESNQPSGVNWAIASINGQSVRYRYHSSPNTVFHHLLRHSQQPVTLNGSKLATFPFTEGRSPQPFARFTRQTGDVSCGETHRETEHIGDQQPPIIHRGLSFAAPEQWAPQHRFSLQDIPNVVTLNFPDHQQNHPNYQADVTAVIYPAYSFDYTNYHEYQHFTWSDKPLIVPNVVTRRLMAQQAIDQTYDILQQYCDEFYPNADISNRRNVRTKTEHTGIYSLGGAHHTCYVNLKPHAIPAIIEADSDAIKTTVHNALRRQTQHPFVPVQPSELYQKHTKAPATVRMIHASIMRTSDRQLQMLTEQQLENQGIYYGPADEIILTLLVSQNGQPDQTIQVPAHHYIAGSEESFIVYATPNLGIQTYEFADLLLATLSTDHDEFADHSDFRDTCEAVAINATMHPNDAFRLHLQNLADAFHPGVPLPKDPVSISTDTFRLTLEPTG